MTTPAFDQPAALSSGRRSWTFAAMVALAALSAPGGVLAQEAASSESPLARLLAFDEAGEPLETPARIAYLSECAQNPYCQARLRGMEAAAEKFGFEFQLFDANFNPADQLKQVQNAVAGGFDGFIIAPTAGAPACNMWSQYLQVTGKPVVVINLPMCGDADHTEGVAATVTMQGQPYFDAHVQNAFASCEGTCKAVAVGGFLGSDLFNLWNNAVLKADEMYDNVEVVSNQPGNFDPRTALRVVQDALSANPDVSIIVSSWDDMTRGIEQAITAAGKTPGQDVRIYSLGGNADSIARVQQGLWNETTVLLPFEESYYGGVAMAMALKGEPLNAHINEAELPVVTEGPGTIFLTPENAAQHEPAY